MAILSYGWYKSDFPKQEIVEISIDTIGNGSESWDGSALQDGSIVCYRQDTKVTITCSNLTAIGDMAFYDFIALKKITGLNDVTTIGSWAFCYTPNLTSVDIIPEKLTSIGVSAFRMSSCEDTLDLSSVSTNIIGDMGTRHKRWSTSELDAIRNITFPKTIYLDVPNPDDQRKYPDVPIGTKDGSILYAKEWGCATFAAYHMWNCMNAGTEKEYRNWLDWYNNTLNADGKYVENNHHDNQMEANMIARLGWTDGGTVRISDNQQLQTIIDRLAIGFPTYVVIYTPGDSASTHAVIINGCDSETHKLSVVDSGMVAWLAFEDMFNAGDSDQDRIKLLDFNQPILAPNETWFTQGNTSIQKSSITEINIKDVYTPTTSVIASWDASAAKDGSINVYVEGTKLTIAGNGSGKVSANADSSKIFNGFSKMVSFNGANILSVSRAAALNRAFYDCMSLKTLDLSSWNTSNVTNLASIFNGMLMLESIDVNNWNTLNVTDMSGVFMCDVKLTDIDLSDWATNSVTTFSMMFASMESYGGPMNLTAVKGTDNWNTSNVTDMSYMFQLCHALEEIDVSNWDTGACSNMDWMFGNIESYPGRLRNIDVSNWDTSKLTSMNTMFQNQKELTSLNVRNWDTSACKNIGHAFCNCISLIDLDVSNWNTSNVINAKQVFNNCSALTTLDVSGWNTESMITLRDIFTGLNSLKKIKIGENFSFSGNGDISSDNIAELPTPSSDYIPGANGSWYDIDGNAIVPSAIKDKTFGVYYATPEIAEEDMNSVVLVTQGSMLRTATAIRSKLGTSTGYTPAELPSAINSIEPALEELIITENGEYVPSEDVDGFSKVITNVAGGGGIGAVKFLDEDISIEESTDTAVIYTIDGVQIPTFHENPNKWTYYNGNEVFIALITQKEVTGEYTGTGYVTRSAMYVLRGHTNYGDSLAGIGANAGSAGTVNRSGGGFTKVGIDSVESVTDGVATAPVNITVKTNGTYVVESGIYNVQLWLLTDFKWGF